MKIQKTFFIQVYENGQQHPIIKIHDKRYEMLYELANEHLTLSEGVRKEIENIDQVMKGTINEYTLSTSDWCIVDVKRTTSTIINGFNEFPPTEVPTLSLFQLLIDWQIFLIKYETGQIPGITKIV